MRFIKRLKEVNSAFFNREAALKLSDEIHEAEVQGYELTNSEDREWVIMTSLIERNT